MLESIGDRLSLAILRLRGFQSRRVPTSVGEVHVLDSPGDGDGPPVLVLHGISASSMHFLGVLPALRRYARRVIAPDMPGHGFSSVPRDGLTSHSVRTGLLEALDSVIDEPVVFCGNSLGGIGAIRYARARPEHVRALLLFSPGGARMEEHALADFLNRFRLDPPGMALAFIDRIYAHPPWYRRFLAPFVRATFGRPHIRALVDRIRPDDLLSPEELEGLEMPIRLVWGKREGLLPSENLEFFKKHMPKHTEIEEPETFGHCPHLDRPRDVVRMIGEYTRKHRHAALTAA